MLYIIKKEYFLADFILDAFANRDDIKIITHRRAYPHGWQKLMQTFRKYWATFINQNQRKWDATFFENDYLNELSRIKSDDKVLFWGVENLKDLLILQHRLAPHKISVFLWNPVRTISLNKYSQWEYTHYLHKNERFSIFTFDPSDADKYKFNFTRQVYRQFDINNLPSEKIDSIPFSDLFFVGRDKSRSSDLASLIKVLQEKSISHYFHILVDKHSVIQPALANYFKLQSLQYTDTLAHIARCKCLVEFTQLGQNGLTIRSLESLFYKKKLITNNEFIKGCDFYHPNNIFILGENSLDELSRFLQSPYHDIDKAIVQNYNVEHWIKAFV